MSVRIINAIRAGGGIENDIVRQQVSNHCIADTAYKVRVVGVADRVGVVNGIGYIIAGYNTIIIFDIVNFI